MDAGSEAAAGPASNDRLLAAQVAQPQTADHLVMKLTRGHSCVLCQQRKVRCDKQKPCANCVKAQVECRVVPPQPPRRRRKKPQERDLIERLKKYEALLAQHGVSFEPIADDFKASDLAEDVADLGQDLTALKTSPESSGPPGSDVDEKNPKYFPYFSHSRYTGAYDSSDDEYEGPTIYHAFDALFGDGDAFPFSVGGTPSSVTSSHPSAIQILQLWQVYISNVNPLLKLSHVPTLQGQIIGAGANPAKIPKPLEALMFGIYFIAVTSMREEDVQSMFGEDRNILLAKYHAAAQQALVNAGFMRSNEIMVLQGYTLYLLAVRQHTDPRSLFCLLGIAARIATRIGLHRDAAQFGVSPFDTEMRRRLWWQIVVFDKRIAEITGSTTTALSASGGDCRFPLNINDTDLDTHAKTPPASYHGPTEMLFSLTRIEMTVAAVPNSVRPQSTAPMGEKPRVHYSPSPSSPDLVTHMANSNLPQDLSGYCNYIEAVYLKQCDPKIPLHFFTLLMTRQALCKLRVIDFMRRGVSTETLEQPDRDALFADAMRAVEYDNQLLSTDSVAGFSWYMHMHVPFPAYMFLLTELRSRNTGDMCARAWDVMLENHERRGMMRTLRNPMHVTFGTMFIKAWDAREAAEAALGNQLQTPKLVTMLKQHMARINPKRGAGPKEGGQEGFPSHAGGPQGYGQQPGAGSAPMSGAGPQVVGMSAYAGGKAVSEGSPMGSEIMGGQAAGMALDDNGMIFGGYGGADAFLAGGVSPVPDADFGQMDWSHYIPFNFGGGGYGGVGGGWPVHPWIHPPGGPLT